MTEQHQPQACVYRFPEVPFESDKIIVKATEQTPCSISFPLSLGLVLENLFIYKTPQDEIIVSSNQYYPQVRTTTTKSVEPKVMPIKNSQAKSFSWKTCVFSALVGASCAIACINMVL